MFFATKNLTDAAVAPCVPWEFDGLALVPKIAFTDKAEREKWLQNPKTEFQCYTAFEGVNSNARVSALKGGGEEGNPPVAMHHAIFDYDIAASDLEIDSAITRMDIKPNKVETTLSGNFRFAFLFEVPLKLPSYNFCKFLLQHHIAKFLPLNQIGGLDIGALGAPERLFTNGCKWRDIHDRKISKDLLLGFMQRVSDKYTWKASENGIVIPLDVAAKIFAEKYPRFASWPGEFVLDSRGPTFWVEGSKSAQSATVREIGIQTLSATAHKPFFFWSDLLGADFVNKYKLEEMGRAVDGVHFDGKSFIRQNIAGDWLFESKDDFSLHLRTERGIADKREKGSIASPIDKAIMFVKNNACVDGAGSYVFFPKGIMHVNGKKFLNTHQREVLQPIAETTIWGPDGKFPWISSFLDGFFSSPEQLPYFISWLSYYYKGCYHRAPSPGQNIVLVGAPGKGKTFLLRSIIGALMSGFTEAKDWMMGQTTFNSDLFDHSFWVLDDAGIPGGAHGHRIFTEMFKRMAANDTFWSNEKFRKATMVQWTGRVGMSCNADVQSQSIVPSMDQSNKEKMSLFRTADERLDGFVFPDDRRTTQQILSRELPAFARFLLDFVIPDHCLPEDRRFGVCHYHEPSLMTAVNHSSNSGTFGEILDEWQHEYFVVRYPDADSWNGTALQWHKSVLQDPSLVEAMKPYNVQTVGRMLATLSEKGIFKIRIYGDEHRRLFEIFRDERFPKKAVAKGPAQTQNSYFQKPT